MPHWRLLYAKPRLRRTLLETLFVAGFMGVLVLLLGLREAHAQERTQQRYRFDIPEQSLLYSLGEFTAITNVSVLRPDDRAIDATAPAVSGEMTADAALRALLEGSGLEVEYRNARTAELVEPRPDTMTTRGDQVALSTLTVSADRIGDDWVYHEPRSVSVISREQIDRRPPRHAADMLEETAGVYSAVDQRDPGLSVNIRGIQDYGRVNMNIDGMRQNYNQNGHQQRNGTMYVDPELISEVTIDKGTSAAQGGAGVLGGIATFNTINASDFLDTEKGYGGRLRAGHGIGDEGNGTHFNGSAVVAFGNEEVDGMLAYSERNFGDYHAGSSGVGNLSDEIASAWQQPERLQMFVDNPVEYASSEMDSKLAKFGWNIGSNPDHRLQFTYLDTSSRAYDARFENVTRNGGAAEDIEYRLLGENDITSTSYGLDYTYNPLGNDLVDFSSKLYFVTTENEQWNNELVTSSYTTPDYTSIYRTDTLGAQAQNTSRFDLGSAGDLAVNYGTEMFQDTFKPGGEQAAPSIDTDLPYVEGLTPEGERQMGSLFANIDYQYGDWLSVWGGLRYDHYRLKGQTGMTTRRYMDNTPTWDPDGQIRPVPITYDVDRDAGRLSPTLGIGINPGVDWLQLYTSYGKGWRPPAVTESFQTGRPHGGGYEMMYPNPYLEPERSESWEAGFNIIKHGLLTQNDRFAAKVAYFDTSIDNFTYMATGVTLPYAYHTASLGQSAYVNNLSNTRFHGVEYELSYDAGLLYADLSYAQMMGSNEFCYHQYYLGGASRLEPSGEVFEREVTLPSGFTFTQRQSGKILVDDPAKNARVNCGLAMGNAVFMPADRASATLGFRFLDGQLDIGGRLRYSEGNNVDHANRNYTHYAMAVWPRYEVYDLYAFYHMTENLTFSLAMDNVTDEAYLVAMGDTNLSNVALARGRTLQGMLEYRF
ncbi:TonB-dependent receptor [Billgrantia gudaonensis]|uniref:Heme acquisition protein HasR n=1 Tax=Billgrantia gudaonensis TaxID=376427 RepID=A0A1G8VRB8_9GAMM|nr:TonB-dependent receptor [Halomonas gudaonensis]SDJ68621.1 heme acquisition protein HasR [Halomonas gudaonensis]